jgi:hypothetical protein
MHYGDLDVLKRDMDILYSINPNYIEKKESMLRMTDYSIFHNMETVRLHKEGKETWYDAVRFFDNTMTAPSYWLTSLTDFPLDVKVVNKAFYNYNIHSARKDFKDKINYIINETKRLPDFDIENTGFLLSESVYDYFKEEFKDLNGILVKNLTFGGSYRVSGLLTKNDIINAIFKEKKFSTYALSKMMFNKFLRDLHGNHAYHDYPMVKLLLN